MDAAKIGQRIQQVRKTRRMTQSQLAAKVDISTKYLSNIECGDKVPKFETFVAIANALEVDANSLLVDVLTVSSVIISSEITEKLAKLSPYEQRRVKRLFDVIVEDEAGDHK
ncbi:helix-turn-helix domain-containing protein [Dysosmobacter sp.]|uniref:helix-turn-helix domain-containing protein n=1 Tax=Dysosmobacter sp. TaxID=2591382 RepID=UPI003AF08470